MNDQVKEELKQKALVAWSELTPARRELVLYTLNEHVMTSRKTLEHNSSLLGLSHLEDRYRGNREAFETAIDLLVALAPNEPDVQLQLDISVKHEQGAWVVKDFNENTTDEAMARAEDDTEPNNG